MLYFYSGILKNVYSKEERRFDGVVEVAGGIESTEQFYKIKKEIEQNVFQDKFLHITKGAALSYYIELTSFHRL